MALAVRRSLAFVNLALFLVAVLALVYLPEYSAFIFYALLIWMFASLALFLGRPADRARAVGAGGGGAPVVPSGSGPPTAIDFCVYCGTSLAPGSPACPACGKPVRPI